jgi:hypothetical protein
METSEYQNFKISDGKSSLDNFKHKEKWFIIKWSRLIFPFENRTIQTIQKTDFLVQISYSGGKPDHSL